MSAPFSEEKPCEAQKQVVAATMKDVALKANVSTATVSRALMNPDKVSQATRNRVEQAALEVGYLPQSLGRNMKRNESRTILVIVPDICDPFLVKSSAELKSRPPSTVIWC